MKPDTTHVIEVDGRRVGWTETGSGRPLVLVHGLGTSGAWWRPVLPALAASRRVLAVDVPGFGLSRAQPVRLDRAADDLACWATAIGLERADWIGHSMGGLVMGDLAARHPGLVDRLILVDAAGMALPQRVSRHLQHFSRSGRYLPLAAYPIAVKAALQAGPMTIARAAHQVLATDLAHRLATIRAPTLVVWGARDALLPVEYGERLAATIPGARFVPIQHAGHSPMWEQPTVFLDTVRAFLDEPLTGPRAASPPADTPEPAVTRSTRGRVRSRYLQVGSGNVHVRVGRPDGPLDTPPIVFVHGATLDSRYHVDVMRGLADRYLVVAPDLPGFGWSSPPDGVLDFAALARALVEFLDAAGIARAVLVGSAAGTLVAARVAVDAPDRVLGVVLTATGDPIRRGMAAQLAALVRDLPHEWPSFWLEHLPAWILAGPVRLLRAADAASRERLDALLPAIRVPVVLVRGADDPVGSRAWVRRAARLAPLGRAFEVSPAGLAVDDRAPEAVARIVALVASLVAANHRSQDDGALPMHIVTATHRRRPTARPRRTRAGPPR